jgi:hypothetical protein
MVDQFTEHVTDMVLHGVQPIQVPGRPRGR